MTSAEGYEKALAIRLEQLAQKLEKLGVTGHTTIPAGQSPGPLEDQPERNRAVKLEDVLMENGIEYKEVITRNLRVENPLLWLVFRAADELWVLKGVAAEYTTVWHDHDVLSPGDPTFTVTAESSDGSKVQTFQPHELPGDVRAHIKDWLWETRPVRLGDALRVPIKEKLEAEREKVAQLERERERLVTTIARLRGMIHALEAENDSLKRQLPAAEVA